MKRTLIVLACALLGAGAFAQAETVRPAEPRPFAVDGVFTDHMVLQRRQPVRISGTAQAGVIVSVTLAGANVRVQTDAAGRWTAELPAMEAGGPYEVVVQALVDAQNGAFSEIRLEDVMIGEVWVASGQSNMEFWVLGRNLEGPRHYHLPDGEEAAALKDPDLRIFYMPHGLSVDGPVSQPPSGARWRRAETRAANGRCSAVAYWFAKELRASLGESSVARRIGLRKLEVINDMDAAPDPAADAGPALAVVSGSAVTLERVTLLPTYRLVVRLVDLTSGATVAEDSSEGLSALPWAFELEYPASAVLPNRSYGVVAELRTGDAVLFRTDTQYPVAAGRDAQVGEMILVRRR